MTGQVITIAQQKGGSGKTTVSSNLALALRRGGARVAILDTDPQGSLGRWFMTRCERLHDKDPGLGFRTASAWGARYEARELAKDHDYVIIDTPPKMGVDGRPAIEVADLVIIPVSASSLDVWATEPTIDLARGENKPVLIVLNRVSARARITADILATLKKMDCRCAKTTLGNRVVFAETSGAGWGVVERQKTSPAAAEITALTTEVKKMLKASR